MVPRFGGHSGRHGQPALRVESYNHGGIFPLSIESVNLGRRGGSSDEWMSSTSSLTNTYAGNIPRVNRLRKDNYEPRVLLCETNRFSSRFDDVPVMSDNAIGLLVLVCIFGASLLGMLLRPALSQHHLSPDTKDAVKLGMGLVGTMAALILGLLVAAAKSAYDTEKNEVTQMAAKIIFLDRVLANYGPESADTRLLLRRMVEGAVNRMWPEERSHNAQLDPAGSGHEELHKAIQKLSPRNDVQLSLKSQAVGVASDLGQLRWLLFEQSGSSISMPLLIVVVVWLAIIFASWGLFAPSNAIAIASLLLAALSVSGAIFLILELDQPFDGVIHISSAPMRNALAHLGR
jgi:hypothetical protein